MQPILCHGVVQTHFILFRAEKLSSAEAFCENSYVLLRQDMKIHCFESGYMREANTILRENWRGDWPPPPRKFYAFMLLHLCYQSTQFTRHHYTTLIALSEQKNINNVNVSMENSL